MCSANTFSTPPEVSLPTAIPANGDEPVMRRIVIPWLRRPYAIPYSSHPLFTATRSSPTAIYESSIHTLELESELKIYDHYKKAHNSMMIDDEQSLI